MNVLLFDIDGTLIDAGGAGQSAMEAAIAEQHGTQRPVNGISTAGRTDRAIAMDLFRFHGIDVTDTHWSRYQEAYFRLLPNALKVNRGVVLPGVKELLAKLSPRNDVLLGLLTGNFAEGAKLKLTHYGLDTHFELGGFGDIHLDRDDVAREALNIVKTRLPDTNPDKVWVIGDTPSDIRCARAIGAKVLAVSTGMFAAKELEQHRPDLLLNDLSQPDSWFQAIGIAQ